MSVILSYYTSALFLALLLILYAYSIRKFSYWKKRNIPYVKPIPFFGNLLPVLRMRRIFGQWLADLSVKIDKDYFGIYVFDRPVLVVQSPQMIKTVLQKDFAYFNDRSVTDFKHDAVLSNFMFFARDSDWKSIRSKSSPAFSSGKLKAMFVSMLRESENMVEYIRKYANIDNVESKEICAKYSTNIIAKCAFGVDAKSFDFDNAEIRSLARRIFEFSYSNGIRQFGAWLAPRLTVTLKIKLIDPAVIDRLYAILSEVIDGRIKTNSFDSNDIVDTLVGQSKKGAETKLDKKSIVGQAMQLFVAGFETVSGSLSFALYELCIHPEIQEKLRLEITENIKRHKNITYEGLLEMKYLDMCVSETLRKYPVLPLLDRTCAADYTFPNSNLTVEKGIPVYIPIWALHSNPKYYPQPEKFDPERFSDKYKFNNDGMNFIPFGEGPRYCIGKRFGLLGVKVGLAAILSKYRLVPTDKTPVPMQFEPKSLVLQSVVGVPLKFVPL